MTAYSRLSIKRIITSLLLFCLIPFIARGTNFFLHDTTLSYMLSINICTSILTMYNWNLIAIHYNRCKEKTSDAFLYSIIGVVLFALWFYFNTAFLKASIVEANANTLKNYGFATPIVVLAFSYILSTAINISFKCLTDHMSIRSNELLIILVSGLLFGLIYTVVFYDYFCLNHSLMEILRNYFFNAITISILSYLYNQSSSFIPGLLALGTTLAIHQLFII